VCGSPVRYHATYQKRLYEKALDIIQIACTGKRCNSTHAIIPSFSVPCCSVGSKELDQFLAARASGETIEQAGQCFVDAGMSPDYPESLNKRFKGYVRRIEFIFEPLEHPPCYAQLIFLLTGPCSDPSLILNLLCGESGFNPVLFSRINILLFFKNTSETIGSYNPPCYLPP